MLTLLLVLLQAAPPVAQPLAAGEAAPYAGVLAPAADFRRILNDRDACIIERDAARKAVVDLRGLPDLLSEAHKATEDRLLTRLGAFTRLAVVELAKAPLPPAPEPSPWYASPWLWGPVGAIVGGSTVWGLTR